MPCKTDTRSSKIPSFGRGQYCPFFRPAMIWALKSLSCQACAAAFWSSVPFHSHHCFMNVKRTFRMSLQREASKRSSAVGLKVSSPPGSAIWSSPSSRAPSTPSLGGSWCRSLTWSSRWGSLGWSSRWGSLGCSSWWSWFGSSHSFGTPALCHFECQRLLLSLFACFRRSSSTSLEFGVRFLR